jgi:hypothetical protein
MKDLVQRIKEIDVEIKAKQDKIKELQKICLEIDNNLESLNKEKSSIIENHLTEKYSCDCSGLMKLYRFNKISDNYFEPVFIRNSILFRENIHTFENDKVQNLIKANVLFATYSWINYSGQLIDLSEEDHKELLESKDFNPYTGDSYDPQEKLWCSEKSDYITRGEWVLDQIVPILHLNEEAIEYISKITEQ